VQRTPRFTPTVWVAPDPFWSPPTEYLPGVKDEAQEVENIGKARALHGIDPFKMRSITRIMPERFPHKAQVLMVVLKSWEFPVIGRNI
jgi:hypothetical protein